MKFSRRILNNSKIKIIVGILRDLDTEKSKKNQKMLLAYNHLTIRKIQNNLLNVKRYDDDYFY